MRGQRLAAVNAVFGITHKGGDVAAANREAFGIGDRRGRRARFQPGKGGLLKPDGTAQIEELTHRQSGVLGIHAQALGAAEVNGDGTGRTQHHATVEGGCVVDRLARCVGTVVLETQALERQLKVIGIKAIQACIVHARLHGGVGLTTHFGLQDAKAEVIDPEAVQIVFLLHQRLAGVKATIGIPHKRRDTRAGDGQQRAWVGAVVRYRALGAQQVVVVDLDCRGGSVFLKTDAALEVGKVRHLQRHIAFGTHHLAHGTVVSQRDRAAGTGGNRQVLGLEVHHTVGSLLGLVELHRQVFHRGQQIAQTHNTDAGGTGRQGGPLACGLGLRADQGQAKIDVVQRQAHGIIRAAIHTGKHVDL